jgi:hypothetical protein
MRFFRSIKQIEQEEVKDASCHSLQDNACRLCVCCDLCPCTTNPYYFVFLFMAVAAGILLLWWISKTASLDLETGTSAKKKSAIGEVLVRDKHEHVQQEQPNDDDYTNLSRKEEQSIIVHRAVDLWERQGVLSKDLADELRATITTYESREES